MYFATAISVTPTFLLLYNKSVGNPDIEQEPRFFTGQCTLSEMCSINTNHQYSLITYSHISSSKVHRLWQKKKNLSS